MTQGSKSPSDQESPGDQDRWMIKNRRVIEIAEQNWIDQEEATRIRDIHMQRSQKMIMIVRQTDHSYAPTPIDVLRRSLHSKLFHRNR
jgi:hypothetical protein